MNDQAYSDPNDDHHNLGDLTPERKAILARLESHHYQKKLERADGELHLARLSAAYLEKQQCILCKLKRWLLER